MLVAASGLTDKLPERITDAIATFVGAMSAAEWDVATDGSISDAERNCVMSYAVWEWLKDFPQLDKFKTKERKDAYTDAVSDLDAIRKRTYGAIEPPLGVDKTTGNWNSKPKLIMRTDPHPQPLDQMQNSPTAIYSNPNAPQDTVPLNSPGVPQATEQLRAIANAGSVVLYWLPVIGAKQYAIYRSTTSGQEVPVTNTPPLVTVAGTVTNYVDAVPLTGVMYFYQIATVNGALVSALSNEASCQP